jgi:hypothetical protein
MISRELTDEWVEIFSRPENRGKDPCWLLAKMGYLPDGVDQGDPRVIEILKQN